MLAFSLLFFIFKLNVPSYVEALFKESDFIKDHYADPTKTTVTFPAETGEWTEWKSSEKQEVGSSVKVPANSFVIYTRL
jgi:hypothetical protein